jgi:H+-transporting ATPase
VSAVIQACCTEEDEQATIEQKVDVLANKGYRVMAVAVGKEASAMEIVGLVGLYDKPRKDSAKLIAKLRLLGISVKMLNWRIHCLLQSK